LFALVCDLLGPAGVRDQVGVNATGLAFNSLSAVEQSADGRTNPMVNAGAIAATSLVPGTTLDERWAFLLYGLSRFAGRKLELDMTVAPGKGGLGTFAPLLDGAGNSVKGHLVARDLSRSLGLDLFSSEPLVRPGN
jgi:glutaminase